MTFFTKPKGSVLISITKFPSPMVSTRFAYGMQRFFMMILASVFLMFPLKET